MCLGVNWPTQNVVKSHKTKGQFSCDRSTTRVMGGDTEEAAAGNNGSGPADSGSQRRRSSRRRGGEGPPGMDDFRRLS